METGELVADGVVAEEAVVGEVAAVLETVVRAKAMVAEDATGFVVEAVSDGTVDGEAGCAVEEVVTEPAASMRLSNAWKDGAGRLPKLTSAM
jgi:hypothetical protein